MFQSLEMIGNIRSAFIDLLEESTWMDKVSKRRAINKVGSIEEKKLMIEFQLISIQASAIDEKIGYPGYLGSDNVTELEKDYAEVRPKNPKVFFSLSPNKFDLV